jgi:hypothetical protein
MKESLKLYGHLQPKIFYTDNVWGDKQFLEESFESLGQDVVPVEKYSHLEAVEIPQDIQVIPKNSAASIADVARIIIRFDSERNVTFHLAPSDKGKGKEQTDTAVVTIGHNKHIYILQIGALLQANKLPVEFEHMLADERVKKVGRMKLMAYYNDWKANLDIKQTLSLTLENRKVVHDLIRNPQCSLQITATLQQPMQLHKVTSGL